MALKKCPKCELNYVRSDAELCDVCQSELRRLWQRKSSREEPAEEEILICTECGEKPTVHGSELCIDCLREQKRQTELENAAELDAAFDEVLAVEEPDEEEEDA